MHMCPGGSSPQQAGTGPLRREPGSPTVVWRCRDGGADQHPCRGRGRPRQKRWLPRSSASLPGRFRAPRCRLPALGAPGACLLQPHPLPFQPWPADNGSQGRRWPSSQEKGRPAGAAHRPPVRSSPLRPPAWGVRRSPAAVLTPRAGPFPAHRPPSTVEVCSPPATARVEPPPRPGTVRTSRAFCAGRSAT